MSSKLLAFAERSLLVSIVIIALVSGMDEEESIAATMANSDSTLIIKQSGDFSITGDGQSQAWNAAHWVSIPQRDAFSRPRVTRMKVLYSDTGLYFLFYCEDSTLSSTMEEDFMDLWKEDVVEAFLWPEEDFPVYFEYEISPLNRELPLLVPNNDGNFLGWRPWNYEGKRKTRHATRVQGGPKGSGAEITSWTAEFFIPYALLAPLGAIPPESGTTWRANFYRIDYDGGDEIMWQWRPVDESFHEMNKFGTIIFQ